MAVEEIMMMVVQVDLLAEEDNNLAINLVQLLHQIQHKETLVVGSMVVAALIEVVAVVVQVVLDNLVPVHILLMPLVVRDLLLQ
jgi:predicted histidine transporter YuiF (NhaC family)